MIPLYRNDPYLASALTVVDRVLPTDDGVAIFCREALFMEGGGQPMDHGVIKIDSVDFPLLRIMKEKGNTGYVIHSDAKVQKGFEVECVLDFARRYKTMRLHSAQHALAGALRIIRKDILTGGMKISDSVTKCSVLYPHHSALKETELNEAVLLVENFIKEDRKISSQTVKSESEAIEAFQDMYRPTVASGSLKGSVRLIVIDGIDANACGGTHVKSLSEVGAVHIDALNEVPDGREVIFSVANL